MTSVCNDESDVLQAGRVNPGQLGSPKRGSLRGTEESWRLRAASSTQNDVLEKGSPSLCVRDKLFKVLVEAKQG